MSRFKPLPPDNSDIGTSGTSPINGLGSAFYDDNINKNNSLPSGGTVEPVEPLNKQVTEKKHANVCGGVAVATKDISRDFLTNEDLGMVKCGLCGYWADRCRHPDLFKGRWPVLDHTTWRRCKEYQSKG